ncbi:hypothetical protein IQ215_05260 [Cyanobacterium stanieri LEGE 03274]|uniref:Uncharacterized protein n=1 Tax=Cyanobacterium stanieri LEGE 03274 TaxID=1828756 RepID=A0ABR9V2H5_9CHRO|nr:hypothetical protein [Cyanobacterium stanieri]MBE9222101.1 hypothetical protein [Cyanobacterium stanieri LEGE 03274]
MTTSGLFSSATIPGTFDLNDFYRTFNIGDPQTRPDARTIDEFNFSVNEPTSVTEGFNPAAQFSVGFSLQTPGLGRTRFNKQIILVDLNDNSVKNLRSGDAETILFTSGVIEIGSDYRVLAVGRGPENTTINLFNPPLPINYNASVNTNTTENSPIRPGFTFTPKITNFDDPENSNGGSLTILDGVLEQEDSLFIAKNQIKGFLNADETLGATVGYADEFLLSPNGNQGNFTIFLAQRH